MRYKTNLRLIAPFQKVNGTFRVQPFFYLDIDKERFPSPNSYILDIPAQYQNGSLKLVLNETRRLKDSSDREGIEYGEHLRQMLLTDRGHLLSRFLQKGRETAEERIKQELADISEKTLEGEIAFETLLEISGPRNDIRISSKGPKNHRSSNGRKKSRKAIGII